MRVYIAGQISGVPNNNAPAFEHVKGALSGAGHEPVNPLDYTTSNKEWTACMRIALSLMLTCDAVALLPDYQNSRGAMIEYELAETLEIPVKQFKEWICLKL